MPAAIDLTGRKFGRLEVLNPTNIRGLKAWICRCECGAELPVITTRLLSKNGLTSCPDCSGARVRPLVDRECSVCTARFQGDTKALFCSAECRQSRRRGADAGVDHLPPPMKDCKICGTPFHFAHNRTTCSPTCLKEKRRRRALANWKVRLERDPELTRKMNRRRRERADADPQYAAKIREWEGHRQARHRERMAIDPEYAARHRERCNHLYAKHAEKIQARRRERLMALSDDDLAELTERTRRYGRKHRRKRSADPIKGERDRAVAMEWRRRRNAGLFQIQASQLLAAASARLDDPARIKPCLECGNPIVGRKAFAKTCSDECANARVKRQIRAGRALARKLPGDRVCPICSTPIDPETCRITCSEPCRVERKRRQKAAHKEQRP